MDNQQPRPPNGKENARNQASQQPYQPPVPLSSNGSAWSGSQMAFEPPQQHFPRDWQAATDQRFLPSTAAWEAAFGFPPPPQIAYQREPALLNQPQSHHDYANYGISPQALQANTANRTVQVSQASSRGTKQNAQAGLQSQPGPSRPAKPASSTALSSRAPEFVYTDPSTIPTGAIQFPHAPYALFEKFAVDLNIGDASVPEYIPRLSLNERERRGTSGDNPEIRTKKTKVKHKAAAKPAPTNSSNARVLSNPDPGDSSSDSEKSESSSLPASSDDEEMNIDEVSPLPPTRPTDEFAAVKFDTIKALWLPSRRRATSEEIKGALKLYWELLKEIHDTWKANSAALKRAESDPTKDGVSKLKVSVSKSLRKIDIAVSTALEFGHRDVLECLADVALPQFLISWLISRVQEDDVNGSITAKILELLCRCTTLTENTLERLKFNKLQHRFSKRGNDHTKVLVKRLIENVAAATRRAGAMPKENESISRDLKTKVDMGTPKAPDPVIGAKRPREPDTSNPPQPKRQNPTPANTNGPAPRTTGPPKRPVTEPKSSPALTTGPNKQPLNSSAKQPTNTKGKVNHVQARKSSLFSSFSSNSQPTPKTSSSSEGSAPTASMGEARAQNVFNFSTAIANLERRTDPESSAPPAIAGPPETPEEKRIRLKKEARRKFTKLGVRFKPADDLTEIRYITHDEEEEDSPEGGHMRDARNDQEEGRIFKQHAGEDVMDEEEDGGPGSVAFLRPWVRPVPIDFIALSQLNQPGDRSLQEENYVSRGGIKEPESLEKGVQEQRETTTLMVVYSDPSDAPRTPREGPDLFSGEKAEQIPFGGPWDITKNREEKIRQHEASSQHAAPVPTPDISSLLKTLQQSQATTPKPMTELEKIFAQYSTAQPTPQPQTLQSAASSLGTPAFPAGLNLARQPSSDSQFQVPTPTQPAQVQQQIQAQQIQAILQQLGQGNAAQGQTFGGLAYSQQQQYPAFPGQSNSQQPQQAHTEQNSSYQPDRDDYHPRNPKDRPNRWGNGDSGGDRRGGRNDYGYSGHGDSRGGVNGDRKKVCEYIVESMYVLARLTDCFL
ncbi:MAG: hypothetical protein M1840_009148 [Geoglossum simile]|nr:MAG: hypothetical protein M1840_009148 [Geoglossum simile]